MRVQILAGALVAVVCVPGAGARGADAEAEKRFREAFRALKLPPAAKVEKDATPLLPGGIVTEAAPFDAAVRKLLEPFTAQLDLRDRAIAEPGGPAAAAAALRTVEAENADLAARVADVEAAYGEVYAAGWMESGENVRRTRKLAAVLIPLYRTIAARNAAVAAKADEGLAGPGDAARVAGLLPFANDASPAVRTAVAAALSRCGTPEARAAVERVRAADPVASVRAAALSALLRWKVAEVKDSVVAALGDAAWEVRATAALVCARANLVEAVEPLVRALEKEDGRLRTDLDDALAALTGQRYYGDAGLWRRWFADNRSVLEDRAKALAAGGAYDRALGPVESWDAPGAAAPAGPAADERMKGATSSFYGIDTASRRVLFVVDISMSMQDPSATQPAATTGVRDPYPAPEGKAKIDVAKWQLHRAIAALPADATFNVVVYSESYKAWQEQMTTATAGAKAKAHAFVDDLKPNGTTNICDSIDSAFDLAGATPLAVPAKGPKAAPGAASGLAADTVFLLSDGDPNRGRISDLTALLESVVARHRRTRIVFHAIGIGEVAGSAFLRDLAARTGGRYVGFK